MFALRPIYSLVCWCLPLRGRVFYSYFARMLTFSVQDLSVTKGDKVVVDAKKTSAASEEEEDEARED